MNVLERWQRQVRRDGRHPAIAEAGSGRTATRSELDEGARRWVAQHAPNGLRGHVVVFALPNGIGWMEAFLGILMAGGIALPLDSAEPPASQQATAGRLGARYFFTHGHLKDAGRGRTYRLHEACLIKLTSGSTGAPKPLVFTLGQMAGDSDAICATMGLRRTDANYGLIPFGHSYGLGNLTFPLLGAGIPIVSGSSPLPHAIAEDFARHGPTVFPGVPALFRGLALSEAPALPGLRLAISAGAPLSAEVAQAFHARFGVRVHGFYGSSETGGIAYDRTGTRTLEGTGVGTPMKGVTVTPLPGQRIRISGAAVLTHGNRRREGRLGAWVAADRVALARDGALQLLGRRDQTVKLGGRRVSLQEVAAALRAVPGVAEVWVGVSGPLEPILGAAIAGSATLAQARAALHGRLPAWKIPKRWAHVAPFPVTARGKTDLTAVRQAVFASAQKS